MSKQTDVGTQIGLKIAGYFVAFVVVLVGVVAALKRSNEVKETEVSTYSHEPTKEELIERIKKDAEREKMIWQSTPPIRVGLDDLIYTYKTNSIKAESLYMGKKVGIRGRVGIVRRSPDGFPVMALYETSRNSFIFCIFEEENVYQLEQISAEDIISITGECEGINKSADVIQISNCKIE